MEIRSATASFVSRGRGVIKRMKAERTKQMLFDEWPVAKAQTVSYPEGKAGDSETVSHRRDRLRIARPNDPPSRGTKLMVEHSAAHVPMTAIQFIAGA